MLATTEGIVLHFIKFGENSVIATIYTREFGRQSFMVNSAFSKKSGNKATLLQPMFLVDLLAYQKQTREIQRVKEIKLNHSYQNIPFDIIKSTQAIFLAEILYKTISEQESNPEMFDFIKNTFMYFDLMEKGYSGFHIWFLLRLTGYLGFLPDMSRKAFENWLDMRKGEVVSNEPPHPMFFNKEATEYVIELSGLKINEIDNFNISRKMRDYLISGMIEYYMLHFETLGEIKSLKILKEVFKT